MNGRHPGHRPGNHLDPQHGVRRRHGGRLPRADRVPPASTRSPAGSSTTPRTSGAPRCRPRARRWRRPGSSRQRHRRDRHHQPARDHRRLGPPDRPSRSPTPSSGRTAAPSRPARRWPPPGTGPWSTERTGLRLDPYFSATKIGWLLDNVDGARARAEAGELAFGTVDSFLLWRLTDGRVHATDATNASRTLLCDIAHAASGTRSCSTCSASPPA